MSQIIHLHRSAPDKPLEGEPCNGCGVCCASEPCPIGIVFSRKLKGACRALFWSPDEQRYRCGLIAEPQRYLPRHLPGLPQVLARLAYRYISAGSGCDSNLQAQRDQDIS